MSARLAFVLGLLALSAVIVVMAERSPDRVNFNAAMELWGDVLRDADDFGLQLTRVSAHDEMELGEQIEHGVLADYHEQPALAQYVGAVGNSLVRHVSRTGIAYKFHVVEASDANAFAVPGGQVFITTAMLSSLRSEAELAGVLGHEISHVDLRHCIDGYQYEIALQRVGAGPVGAAMDFARLPLVVSYTKYQEAEADEQGMTLAIEAGYDPRAMVDVMTRFERTAADSVAAQDQPSGPVAEATAATVEALGAYLRSHPLDSERVEDLNELIASDHRRLGSCEVYEGVENYRERIPMSERRYPDETKEW